MALVTLSAPAQNSILNDANITQLLFEDTATDYLHYEARFYINNVEYDRVILPRFTNSKMVLEFENLLLKYLEIPEPTGSYIQAFPMINNLKIDIWKAIDAGNLGLFYTLANTFNYKTAFSYVSSNEMYFNNSLTFIAVDANTLLIDANSMIQLPFHTTNTSNSFILRLIKEDGTNLSEVVVPNPNTSRTYLATMSVYAPPGIESLLFSISVGTESISKRIRVFRNGLYQPKRIQFSNRYGMPMSVDLFGKMKKTKDIEAKTYTNSLSEYITAEINQERLITIDTGYLLESEKGIVDQIATSLHVKIRENNVYHNCVVSHKSIPLSSDNEFNSNVQLQFRYNNSSKYKNV